MTQTSFFYDVKTGVRDVMVLDCMFILFGECAYQDGVVLRGNEGDSVELEGWWHTYSKSGCPGI